MTRTVQGALDPYVYVKARQTAWARRHGIRLVGSEGDRGALAYTATLAANLFEPLSPDAAREFAEGDGAELGDGRRPGKMQAVHSSSALGCNLFHYWRSRGDVTPIARALGLPRGRSGQIRFEKKLPIAEGKAFRFSPNVDVVIEPAGPHGPLVGIECKFSEAYSTRKSAEPGLKKAYLGVPGAWDGLTRARRLAEELASGPGPFSVLHAAQLLKHLLGLRRAASAPEAVCLAYLWYDVPGPAGATHRAEVAQFGEVLAHDGVRFLASSYQEVILRLGQRSSEAHRPYLDYLAERYL